MSRVPATEQDGRVGRPASLLTRLRTVATVTVCGALPVLTLVTMFAVGLGDDSLADDFHHEIYPQAELMLDGENPYPDPSYEPRGANFIWPPAVVYALSPLTLLPPTAADVVMVVFGLACFALALWTVGVRDWRVYGVVALWPEVASEMRVAHLTAPLSLLAALAWRHRRSVVAPGIAVGVATALKFLAWPMAIWLLSRRRVAATVVAAGLAGASTLLILPFLPLHDYARVLAKLGRRFDQDSYTLFGLLVQAGASETAGRVAVVAVGALLVAATWRYQSFTLAIAAALVLSPIVWLDYFALAIVPLALARPRLSAVWFLPLTTWGMSGAGLGIGDARDIARLLVVFAVVFAVAFRDEPDRRATGAAAA